MSDLCYYTNIEEANREICRLQAAARKEETQSDDVDELGTIRQQISTEKDAREQAERNLALKEIVRASLEQRAETAEKARAEMRDALLDAARLVPYPCGCGNPNCFSGKKIRDALKPDAGRDYIHKSKLDAALEALKNLTVATKRWVVCANAVIRGVAESVELVPLGHELDLALTAEQVLKANQKENHETTKS